MGTKLHWKVKATLLFLWEVCWRSRFVLLKQQKSLDGVYNFWRVSLIARLEKSYCLLWTGLSSWLTSRCTVKTGTSASLSRTSQHIMSPMNHGISGWCFLSPIWHLLFNCWMLELFTALRLIINKLFVNTHCNEGHLARQIFMPWMFLKQCWWQRRPVLGNV